MYKRQTLQRYGIDPCYIEIEVTESVIVEKLDSLKAVSYTHLASSNGQAVVDYARQFLGNPYVYGGNSLTNGTDCSGFVKGVYAAFGINLPRTSSEQRSVGYAVSPVSYTHLDPVA